MVHCFVCFPPVDSVLHKEKGLIHVLGLREIDFDSAGDFKFPSGNGDKQMRGGMPYYQPNSNWTRIGLRVRRRYDNGNDDWLKMDGNPHEWAVGFHGSTKKSTSDIAHTRPFWVRQGGFWVRQGGQAYETDKDVNSLSDKKGQPCGKGAYFAAKIDDAYKNCVIDNHACIFQVSLYLLHRSISFYQLVRIHRHDVS